MSAAPGTRLAVLGRFAREFPWPVFLRLVAAWAVGAGFLHLLTWQRFAALLPRTALIVSLDSSITFGAFLPLMGAVLWCAAARTRLPAPPFPSAVQVLMALPIACIAAVLAFSAQYPPPAALPWFAQFPAASPLAVNAISAAVVLALLVLPMAAALLLLFPWRWLRERRLPLVAAFLIVAAYFFSFAAGLAYHALTVGFTLRLAMATLALLPGTTAGVPEHWWIQYEGFRLNVGPGCSGLPVVVIFATLFAAFCWRFPPRSPIAAVKAALGGLLPCALLPVVNAFRIAAIAVVGAHAPGLAVALLHGTGGTLLFLLLFLAYTRIIVPRVLPVPASSQKSPVRP